jgi:hypothetical protein
LERTSTEVVICFNTLFVFQHVPGKEINIKTRQDILQSIPRLPFTQTRVLITQSQSFVDLLEEVNFLRFQMDINARSSEMCGRVVWQITQSLMELTPS